MAATPFVHLHCHTEYSLLDGAIRTKDLAKKALEYGMPAVAMTDHGNLFGAVEFYQAAEKVGVKPIVGCEAYVTAGNMRDRGGSAGKESNFHLTLLAADAEGYGNLVKLISSAHLEGFYYKPRVDRAFLAENSRGIIALSGCLKGEVNSHIISGDLAGARNLAAEYRDIFGAENYFIELHDHGIDAQRRCNPELIKIARDLDLDLVAANDVHFLERRHHESHDVMLCIGTGSLVIDEKRMRYSPELYFKSGDEMAKLFAEVPEAITNTLRVAERCQLKMEFGQPKYPAFESPAGSTREQYLRDLCWEGLRARYGERAGSDEVLRKRLEYELSVIEKTGFVSYFLIVWDFINYAKQNGIPVGPGRGSAAGSLIAYVLAITDIDPLRYGLIFERFLNPERISPPDIDVDFCMERRGEVIDYVRKKYGERCVSQIVTFGTMGAKSVVRDVGRVLGWSYGDGDRLAKMIPNELNITLSSAAEKNVELKASIENEPATRALWDHALILEGLSRNTGIHAAGVVIGDRPLDEYIPLCRGKDNEVITQYEMNALTELGMLKMDFLGLKTLTVLEDAVRMIRMKEPSFNVAAIPTEDKESFDIYNRGETLGVFQMESGGITNCCKRFDVGSIEDIIAIGALYRPGPMQFIDDYIARKKGKPVEYAHPLLKEVCEETYGIMVYQEQVQRAANVLAGYSLGDADLLRRAMGKKDKEKMAKERIRFVEGCKRVNDIGEGKANAIFDFIARFAEYGFNKSHSAAYGWVSYQTAYVKARFPVEFMAALLTHDASTTDRLAVVIAECSRMGIKVLPPDVNKSGLHFTPEKVGEEMAIRFGLASIKNVGAAAMEAMIEDRQKNGTFDTLDDFCSRLDSRTVNRKILESLVKCGAFDGFRKSRAQLFSEIEQAMSSAAAVQRDRASGQAALFDSLDMAPTPSPSSAAKVEPWPQNEMLSYEKELLGYYITGHPLQAYAGHFDSPKITTMAAVQQLEETSSVKMTGLINSVEKKFTKKDGRPFAIILMEDFTGQIELTAWDETYTKNVELLQPGTVVGVNARIMLREDGIRATATSFAAMKPKASVKPVRLRLARSKLSEGGLSDILEAVKRYPGKRPLIIEIVNDLGFVFEIEAAEALAVGDEGGLRSAVSTFSA